MAWMFQGSKATSIDLSSFDTSNVTGMTDMFMTKTTIVICSNLSKKTTYLHLSAHNSTPPIRPVVTLHCQSDETTKYQP